MRWNKQKGQVKNVANVKKMRKFEPLRKTRQAERHIQNILENSGDEMLIGITTDLPEFTGPLTYLRNDNSLYKEEDKNRFEHQEVAPWTNHTGESG